jgi:Tfp pilus assembly protein PilX
VNLPDTPSGRSHSGSFVGKGFALVVTLSLMILLTIIAVGLLTLSSVSLRSSSAQNAQAAARANARMALMIAIGELQKLAGPDQRVTLTSEQQPGSPPENPNWTGVTDVSPGALTPDTKNAPIRWLVSGVHPPHLNNPRTGGNGQAP